MKVNLSEMRKISRRLWETLRSSDDRDNVFYILSLMLIQLLSFSNENKKKYFQSNKDFFYLMRLNENLDKEVNSLLSHFKSVNPLMDMLVKRSDFTEIGRTKESRNKIIKGFLDILTDIQKNVEVRKIPESMRVLLKQLKQYYLWKNAGEIDKEEIDGHSGNMLFRFSNNRENQEIYNPVISKSDIMYEIPSVLESGEMKSVKIYGNMCFDDEFTVFLFLDNFFKDCIEMDFCIKKKSFLDEPILDGNGKLKKFDLIAALPILYFDDNPDRKKMKRLQELLTVKVGNLNEYKNLIYSFLLSSLKEDGILNMIVPYSFLTAGDSDLRRYLVENDILYHIENLPMNVFTGKAVDAAFVSINMNKSREIKDMTVFRFDKESKKRLVSNQKIAENGFNLSVSQYISSTPPVPKENAADLLDRLDKINSEIRSRIYDLTILTEKTKP
ncbi:MAG: N-6 DNA methylase [bacterium]